jgi:hypothetical protein
LAGEYPIGIGKDVGWKPIRDSEICSGHVKTIHSRDLDINGQPLGVRFVEDTGQVEDSIDERGNDQKHVICSVDREILLSPRIQP